MIFQRAGRQQDTDEHTHQPQESGHGQIQEQVQSPTDTEYQIHGDSGAI